MKTTKVMLVFLGVLVITWISLGTIAWIFSSQITYKEALILPGVVGLLFIFGWIPAVIVSIDYEESYE
jgi:hypothetical protein